MCIAGIMHWFVVITKCLCVALMKVLLWLLHPDPRSRATLKDLQKDKWTNQEVDPTSFVFEVVLGEVK